MVEAVEATHSSPNHVLKEELHENGFTYHRTTIDSMNTVNAGNRSLSCKTDRTMTCWQCILETPIEVETSQPCNYFDES